MFLKKISTLTVFWVLVFFTSCSGTKFNNQDAGQEKNQSSERQKLQPTAQAALPIPTPSPVPFSCSGEFLSNSPYADGDGSPENPLKICTTNQFRYLSDSDCNETTRSGCSKAYELETDLDLSGENLSPIGSGLNFFEGIFDGKGHVLKNISINKPGPGVGVFSVIGASGQVTHLKLAIKNVKADSDYIGGLVGKNEGSISKVSVRGEKTLGYHLLSSGSRVGGIAGDNSGTITQSMSDLRIKGLRNVGGVAGTNASLIENSYSSGMIDATSNNSGGIAGSNSGTIVNSYSKTIGKMYSITLGGIVGGFSGTGGTVTNSFWDKTTSGIDKDAGTAQGLYSYDLSQKVIFDNDDDINDWNFDTVWSMPESGESPELKWENENSDLKLAYLMKDGRKIGYSDMAAFQVSGFCKTQNTSIIITNNTDGVGSTTATCNGGQWVKEIDLTSAGEGNIEIEFSSGSITETRTFNKESTICSNKMNSVMASDYLDEAGAYVICTRDQWNDIHWALASSRISETATIKLYNNIDFAGTKPTLISFHIGNNIYPVNHFHGNRFRLNNIVSDYSIFGTIDNQGTGTSAAITDLGVENSRIISTENVMGGIIRGTNSTNLSSLYFQGVVAGTKTVGGLFGVLRTQAPSCAVQSTPSVSNSFFIGSVHGSEEEIGGIAGKQLVNINCFDENEQPTITTSFAKGSVRGRFSVGGIVGVSAGVVKDAYFQGSVLGSQDYIGGIAGTLQKLLVAGVVAVTDIDNSYVKGQVTGRNVIGGIVGNAETYATLSNHYIEADLHGANHVGGVIGYNGIFEMGSGASHQIFSASLSNAYSLGDIMASNDNVGGLVGRGVTNVTASKSSSNVYGANNLGGLFGYLEEAYDDNFVDYLSPVLAISNVFVGGVESFSSGDSGPIVGTNSEVTASSTGYGTEILPFYDSSLVTLVNTNQSIGTDTDLSSETFYQDGYINSPLEAPFSSWDSTSVWKFSNEAPPSLFGSP